MIKKNLNSFERFDKVRKLDILMPSFFILCLVFVLFQVIANAKCK